MNDNHFHSHHHHSHAYASSGNIKLAFLLNISFAIFELIGGFLTNSLAIIADAIHDFGDSFSLGLTWYFDNLSKKDRDRTFTYGYKRFSLVGAIVSAVVLGFGSIFVLREAIPRILNPQDTNAEGMLLLAVFGVLVNGIAALRLSRGSSLSEKIVSLHLLEDLFGWLAVLVASIIMVFVDLPVLDPILSVCIACFILLNLYKQIIAMSKVLLQAIPESIDLNEIERKLMALSEISGCHDARAWTMDGQYHVLTIHLVLNEDVTLTKLKRLKDTVKDLLHHEGIEHSTIEYELEQEYCELSDRQSEHHHPI